MYSIANKDTGMVCISIRGLMKCFRKRKILSSESTVKRFIEGMIRLGILYKMSPTNPKKTREHKTNIYVFLDVPLFRGVAKEKISSERVLNLAREIRKTTPGRVACNSLKLQEENKIFFNLLNKYLESVRLGYVFKF